MMGLLDLPKPVQEDPYVPMAGHSKYFHREARSAGLTFTERLKVQDFPIDKRFDLAEFQEEFQEELLNKLQEALI